MPIQSPLNNRELLTQALDGAASKKQVLERLALRAAGGNYKALDKALNRFSLSSPVRSFPPNTNGMRTPDEEVFSENSSYSNSSGIKKRLREKGFPQECSECHLGSEWNGKPLTLQLEHINGVHSDNRLENLTLLCPNCHSQTSTFAGNSSSRALRRDESGKIVRGKCRCGDNVYSKGVKQCMKCAGLSRRKAKYPPMEKLLTAIEANGYSSVALDLGVSDNAVRKHIRSHGYEPPRFHRTAERTDNAALVRSNQSQPIEKESHHGNL